MCKMNESIYLSGDDDCQVSWCSDCHKFSLYFKQICFSFDEREFVQFKALLAGLRKNHFQYFLRDERQVLIKNNLDSSGFFLTQPEVKHMHHLLSEAEVMFEVKTVLH